MPTNTSSESRFKFTDIINVNGIETYGKWVQPKFLSNPPRTRYEVPIDFEGAPDLIAKRLYGDEKFYWAIIAYNAPENTLNWPRAGDIIVIPELTDILAEM